LASFKFSILGFIDFNLLPQDTAIETRGSGAFDTSFAGGLLVQRAVWSILVVVLTPVFDRLPRFCKGQKPILIQALLSQSAVEAFDESIVCRLAWPAELELHAVTMCPVVDSRSIELEFFLATSTARKQSLAKLDLLIRSLTDFRQALHTEVELIEQASKNSKSEAVMGNPRPKPQSPLYSSLNNRIFA
jgi:hypothetical protein